MRSLILNINRENNWLSSTATAYLTSGEYNYNTDSIQIGNLSQDVINNFSEVIQYFVELSSGQWLATQVIAENGSQFESIQSTTEQYIEEYTKPTINLKISDILNANPAMHRTAYYNSKNFSKNAESGTLFIWDYFKNNY